MSKVRLRFAAAAIAGLLATPVLPGFATNIGQNIHNGLDDRDLINISINFTRNVNVNSNNNSNNTIQNVANNSTQTIANNIGSGSANAVSTSNSHNNNNSGGGVLADPD